MARSRRQNSRDHYVLRAISRGAPAFLCDPDAALDIIMDANFTGYSLTTSRTAYLVRYKNTDWILIYSRRMKVLVTIMPASYWSEGERNKMPLNIMTKELS